MLSHPLHPIFVHFTVGLTVTAILTHFLATIVTNKGLKQPLHICSSWMFITSAIATIFTLLTGYLQFISVEHDAGSHLAMVSHRYWAIGTGLVLFTVAVWSIKRFRNNDYSSILFHFTLLALLGTLSVTAYKGGSLVYDFGLGVKSTPELRKIQKESGINHHDSIFDPEEVTHDDGHNHEH